ncbi:MAG TPA: DNA topoisomerase IV subunit A [Polyangiales bacterium]|nr:DNA topoisomerase IV subunit A [Polyangiales bacterium]
MAQKRKAQGGRAEDDTLPGVSPIMDASLSDEAQRRYLHYALSVITSRALPDVRDGLKPVQRRILYTMWNDMHLRADAKYRKCAAIVGDVMGKYHPHGDTAIYDALARMAQDFSLRAPLVDGRGNFGSADGDEPAAMRYTEAKLQKLAAELIEELGQQTVAFRPNYDGTRHEPVVLPARYPNLLVNGVSGIAVGMATSIPPHNFGEVIDASVAMIDDPELTVKGVLKHIKGPDFPTAGQLLSTKKEIETVYAAGQGSFRLRGEWKLEEPKRGGALIVITSIPYAVRRGAVVEKVAEVIIAKKLPTLLDVRDESTAETRIVLEIKKDTDPQLVMAYLYKHTPLQTNVNVDFTCLIPTDNPEIAGPARVDLRAMLRHFLDFRMEVVEKRLKFQLDELRRRIHILEGFAKVFDALDETIRIIRKSEGKKDAAEKLMKRFDLSAEQVDAILELKLYRLAQLEILLIQKELDEKRREEKRIAGLLRSADARWKLIRAELLEIKTQYSNARRTKIVGNLDEPEFEAEDFIHDEDAIVVLSRQGWMKRQREMKDVSATRVREGDAVLDLVAGSTKSAIAFFSNLGTCYVSRVVDIQATSGYGSPVQNAFKMDDGERIVRMIGFDPRVLEVPPPEEGAAEPGAPYIVAVTKRGMSLCGSLRPHREPSTRSGRRFMRLDPGDEVIYVGLKKKGAFLACASVEGQALICDAEEVGVLAGPGKGVKLIKLEEDDTVIGAQLLYKPSDALIVEKESGSEFKVSREKYKPVSRGGKGHALFQRGTLAKVILPQPEVPTLPEAK